MNEASRRLLPPISALASFVAAGRYASFSKAGDEVGLSQSAISRQIAQLENWLQVSLFKRNGRRVELSRDGEAYLAAIEPALKRIRAATATMLSKQTDRELNIATLPSFGMRWLAPRLIQLTSRHPDIVVNFAARSFPFSFADEPFDAAIHFGLPDWPDANHDLLFREKAIPVCSPTRLARYPIAQAEDVCAWPLLVQTSRRDAWEHWFAASGLDAPSPTPSGSFEHFMMLAQAAAAGTGIALIPRFLIETELAEGKLVSPLPIALGGERAYYLVTPSRHLMPTALSQFRSWLLEEALATNSELPPSCVRIT